MQSLRLHSIALLAILRADNILVREQQPPRPWKEVFRQQ